MVAPSSLMRSIVPAGLTMKASAAPILEVSSRADSGTGTRVKNAAVVVDEHALRPRGLRDRRRNHRWWAKSRPRHHFSKVGPLADEGEGAKTFPQRSSRRRNRARFLAHRPHLPGRPASRSTPLRQRTASAAKAAVKTPDGVLDAAPRTCPCPQGAGSTPTKPPVSPPNRVRARPQAAGRSDPPGAPLIARRKGRCPRAPGRGTRRERARTTRRARRRSEAWREVHRGEFRSACRHQRGGRAGQGYGLSGCWGYCVGG